ncbi:MAG: NAD(P)-binding domain-containing protein [Minwuiales bacterium]|nr:NAD(P)-binding domain-containing protein [Minwuiales bacterium]
MTQSTGRERIGFIGLGAMGRPMASNLQRKGNDLVVYELNPEAVDALVGLGARAAGSVAELAREVDIVVTMLPDSPDVEAVVLGPDGVAATGAEDLLVMDMSTVDPVATDRLATALADRGMAFVDAPVGRLVSHAEKGESLFMVGATSNDFGRVRPLLEAMGTTIQHCGAPGSGIRTKLVNNFIAIATCQLTAEAMTLAESFGLDLSTTLDVVNGTTATNGHLQTAWRGKVLAGDTAPGFRIRLAHKDISLAVEAARQAGVPVFMGAAARECLGQAMRTGDFAERDFSALLDMVCQQSGIAAPRL